MKPITSLKSSIRQNKLMLSIALGFSMAAAYSNARADYAQSIVAQTAFQTAPTTWTTATDDSQIQVPIGFGFVFNGTTYTQVFINSNGALSFSAGFNQWTNTTMPVPTPNPQDLILPFWDDLDPVGGAGTGTISYGTIGTAPNRQFVASWNGVKRYNVTGSLCSFQVVLNEDQSIRYRYGNTNVSCDTSSATIGVQENSALFIQRSVNAVVPLTQDVLYNRTSVISFQKNVTLICDPLNGPTGAKNIPLSMSRWTLKVKNTGLVSATLSTISDLLDARTVFDPNLVVGGSAATCQSTSPGVPQSAIGRGFKLSITGSTRTGYPKFLTNIADADGATFTAPNSVAIDFAAALPVAAGYTAGQLKPGEEVTIELNFTLN